MVGGRWISERQADGENRDNERSGLSGVRTASPRWFAARGRGTGGVWGGVKGAGESARCRLPHWGERQKRRAEAQPAKEAVRGSC